MTSLDEKKLFQGACPLDQNPGIANLVILVTLSSMFFSAVPAVSQYLISTEVVRTRKAREEKIGFMVRGIVNTYL